MFRSSLTVVSFPWLLYLTLLLTLTQSQVTAQRSSYNEVCNKTLKCDRRASLACTPKGICDCSSPHEMLYEPLKAKCVSKAGEACKFFRGERDGDEIPTFELTPCVTNSECSHDGFCSCDSRYFENVNGTCTLAQSHQQPCNAQLKCSRYEDLHCAEDGTCECDPRRTIYSPTSLQCVGLAGESCINDYCSVGASCSNATNVCLCDSDYFQNSAKLCQRKFPINATCSNSSQCQVFNEVQLACEGGICNCDSNFSRFGTAQRHLRFNEHDENDSYDYEDYEIPFNYAGIFNEFEGDNLTQCLGLAGSSCLDRLCVPRAYCSQILNDRETGKCVCQYGFTMSKKGNCGRGFNQHCSGGDGCIDGLVCKQGVCACPYENQGYNEQSKSCRFVVGGPCSGTEACRQNAECSFDGTGDTTGHCRCKSGFIENEWGGCEVMYGGYCTPSVFEYRCDNVAKLVCINNTCACPEFSKYNHDLRRCVGLVGSKCNWFRRQDGCVANAACQQIHPKLFNGRCSCKEGFNETDFYTCQEVQNEVELLIDLERGQMVAEAKIKYCTSVVGCPCSDSNECIKNAECSFDGIGDTTGHCLCKSGFVENQRGECEIMYGGYCTLSANENPCDQVAGLVCINNACACPKFSKYNHDRRECMGLVGAKCYWSGQQDGCVANATCQPIHSKLFEGRCICKEGFNETDFYTCQAVEPLIDVEKGQMVEKIEETADKDKGEGLEE